MNEKNIKKYLFLLTFQLNKGVTVLCALHTSVHTVPANANEDRIIHEGDEIRESFLPYIFVRFTVTTVLACVLCARSYLVRMRVYM